MSFNKRDFARFLLEEQVLMFGSFTLKSGRTSPHFFNSGRLDNGRALDLVGTALAQHILATGGADIVFGPAYKGIPLAVAVASAMDRLSGNTSTGVLFDRKEVKSHGDGGLFVGRVPQAGDRVVLVDDVISSGVSLAEAAEKLQSATGVSPVKALVCVDRQERGRHSEASAASEIANEHGFPVEALVRLDEVVSLMAGEQVNDEVPLTDERQGEVAAYLKAYGAV